MSPDSPDITVVVTPPPAIQATVSGPAPIPVVVEPAELLVVTTAHTGPQGPEGPQGPPGGAVLSGWWQYNTSELPPPGVGQIRTTPDPIDQGQPITVYLHHTDDDGLVWGHGIALVGDRAVLRGEHGKSADILIEGLTDSVPGPDGYTTMTGTVTKITGQPTKNARVQVSLVHETGMKTVQNGHTFAIPGVLDSADRFPGFAVPVAPGTVVSLVRVAYRIRSGTSATFSVHRNGNPVAGLTNLVADTSPDVAVVDFPLADLDYIEVVPGATVGAPTDFSATIMLETALTS